MPKPKKLPIVFLKEVTFRDQEGTVLKVFNAGDAYVATGKTEHYYVTGWGGVYLDEACEFVS